MPTRRTILTCLAGMASSFSRTHAQTIKKPVHIVVGFPAGGATDLIARILAERLRGAYAPAVIVENKPGGAARVAVEYIKNAAPDGSEILFTPDFPLTVYPHSFRTLSYDPMRDLVPVAPASQSTLTFVVGPAVPDRVTSLTDFIVWCQANPDKALFATTSAGGTPHFVGVMLANAAGVRLSPVHYRGGAPALHDLVGGHIASSVNPIGETMPFLTSAKLRILAVTSAHRSKFLPQIPTMREAGFNVVVESWLGAFTPAKSPPEAVQSLNAAIGAAVRAPETIESLAKIGSEPVFATPGQFAAAVKADMERWGPVVKTSGFVAED